MVSSHRLLQAAIGAARAAGDRIMASYGQDLGVRHKADQSPVTEADDAAEAVIVQALARVAPDVPIVSEEATARGAAVHTGPRFWLVDPLDGTKEFIARNGEFTVNIALIHDGRPVLGVVLAPAWGRLYAGRQRDGGEGGGSEAFVEHQGVRRPIRCRAVPEEGCVVVSSRSHGDEAALQRLLGGRRVAASMRLGSSLKLCLVAAGEADLYPRHGRTMEWDIAAGHAVLLAAGGDVRTLLGEPLRYGKPGLVNPDFVAAGA